jgi:recombinational DNA repair protein (RecF pathway)
MNDDNNKNPRLFSGEKGGFVCSACQKAGDYYISFSVESFRLFKVLQTASLNEASAVPISLRQAEQILEVLTSFLSSQTGFNAKLKSLAFIEKLKTTKDSK